MKRSYKIINHIKNQSSQSAELENLKAEVSKFTSSNSVLLSENNLLKEEKSNLEVKILELTEGCEKVEKSRNLEIEDLKTEVSNLMQEKSIEIENLEKIIDQSEVKIRSLETNLGTSDEKLRSIKLEFENSSLNSTENLKKSESEVCRLKAELSSTLEQLEDASLAAEEAQAILSQLREIEEKNLVILESLRNSESEKESLKNELTLLKNSQISQETLQSNKNALDEANKTIQGLQNGNKVLQKTIESLEKEKLALKAQAVDGGKFIVRISFI